MSSGNSVQPWELRDMVNVWQEAGEARPPPRFWGSSIKGSVIRTLAWSYDLAEGQPSSLDCKGVSIAFHTLRRDSRLWVESLASPKALARAGPNHLLLAVWSEPWTLLGGFCQAWVHSHSHFKVTCRIVSTWIWVTPALFFYSKWDASLFEAWESRECQELDTWQNK